MAELDSMSTIRSSYRRHVRLGKALGSDEVRTAVHVHRGARDVAVAPRDQVGRDGRDLLGQAGAAEIAWLMEVLVDPGHHVVRVGRIEALGGQDLLEILGEAGRHDGARAYA